MRIAILGLVLVAASCGPRVTGAYGEACMGASRPGANAALCSCVQQVANRMLSASDQRLAATFFEDEERANAMMINDSPAADAFWVRYRAFTDQAERSCRR